MAKCKWCGKGGLFQKLTKHQLCRDCAITIQFDLESHSNIIKGSIPIVESSKNADTVDSRFNLLMEHAKYLHKYELKGIPTITPNPSFFLNEYRKNKDKFIIQALKKEFDVLVLKVFELKTVKAKLSHLENFNQQITKYKAILDHPNKLDDLEQKLMRLKSETERLTLK